MRPLKSILLIASSLFLAYRTYDLFVQLSKSTASDYNAYQTIVISIIINLFITGVFALPGFALPSSKLLPDSYYRVSNPGIVLQIYKIVGMKYFRVFLMFLFWGRKSNRLKYFDGTRTGINNLKYQSKQSEFGHLASFLVILIISLLLFNQGYYLLFCTSNLLNLIANGYPIILQRHHRMRIHRLAAISSRP